MLRRTENSPHLRPCFYIGLTCSPSGKCVHRCAAGSVQCYTHMEKTSKEQNAGLHSQGSQQFEKWFCVRRSIMTSFELESNAITQSAQKLSPLGKQKKTVAQCQHWIASAHRALATIELTYI